MLPSGGCFATLLILPYIRERDVTCAQQDQLRSLSICCCFFFLCTAITSCVQQCVAVIADIFQVPLIYHKVVKQHSLLKSGLSEG